MIRQRLVAYRKQTEPLLEYYGAKGLLKTYRRIWERVDEVFARAARSGSAVASVKSAATPRR